jgi:hypothetical protein
MKFIKLCGNGSTWYLPKGLPGVLAIVTRTTVIYCIKEEAGCIPKHFMNSAVFCGHVLNSTWQDMPFIEQNHRVPIGYSYRYRHYYWNEYYTISEIQEHIKDDFSDLEKVYYKNKGLKFYLKAKWGDLVDRVLP